MFDHWLLVEMRGSDPALTGQKLLVVACGLRARLGALLSGALVEAEKRKRSSGGRSGEISADWERDGEDQEHSQDRFETGGKEEGEEGGGEEGGGGLQDVPPLLMRARRAWLEGGKLGGRGGGGAGGDGDGGGGGGSPTRTKRWHGHGNGQMQGQGREQQWQNPEASVDWAQEAEDLSVDLAEFMLQSIGYV